MESMVSAIAERVPDERVTRIRLQVGVLAAVVPDALRFSFDVCARGTPMEGATLEIITVLGRAVCRRCAAELQFDQPIVLCDCGSADVKVTAGHELKILDVEVQKDVRSLRV